MKRINRFGILVILGVVFVLFILLMRFFWQRIEDRYTFTTSSRTVIKELRSLNRLETASFTIEKVIDAGTNGNQFQQFLFGDRILLIAHGEVIAGFDLSKLSDDDIQVNGKVLRLTLPAPQILSARLDSEETRVYDRRQGVLSKGDKDLESEARSRAEMIIRQAACQGKILNEATKNAQMQLTALFKTLGFETVILDIPQGGC